MIASLREPQPTSRAELAASKPAHHTTIDGDDREPARPSRLTARIPDSLPPAPSDHHTKPKPTAPNPPTAEDPGRLAAGDSELVAFRVGHVHDVAVGEVRRRQLPGAQGDQAGGQLEWVVVVQAGA